jgi:hypothetical protein
MYGCSALKKAALYRLAELHRVLNLTDRLAAMLEQHCTRSVSGLRTAVQQFCRAGLDAMHNESMRSLTGEARPYWLLFLRS